MEKYTPKIIKYGAWVYVEMKVAASYCHLCSKVMITEAKHGVFPSSVYDNQEAQMKAAGLVFKSSSKVDGNTICKECEQSGKASFLCSICQERRPTSMIKESIGDPAEYLCTQCYETVPAKVWEEKVEDLQEEHRYDFE